MSAYVHRLSCDECGQAVAAGRVVWGGLCPDCRDIWESECDAATTTTATEEIRP